MHFINEFVWLIEKCCDVLYAMIAKAKISVKRVMHIKTKTMWFRGQNICVPFAMKKIYFPVAFLQTFALNVIENINQFEQLTTK